MTAVSTPPAAETRRRVAHRVCTRAAGYLRVVTHRAGEVIDRRAWAGLPATYLRDLILSAGVATAERLWWRAAAGKVRVKGDLGDPGHGVDFAAFAIPTILGEIKRHFRDRAWTIRVPRRLQELRMSITAANSSLDQALGRPPTVADLAGHLGVSEEEILEGLEGAQAYSATSLSTPVGDDGGQELVDTLGTVEHGYELAELRIALGPAMAGLSEREQTILSLRFYGNRSQTQIAEQVGVSQMHVSRLLTPALAKLRVLMEDDGGR